MQPQTEDMNK